MGRDAWNLVVAAAALIPASAACALEVDFSAARFHCASSAECPDGQECAGGYCAAPPEGGGAAAADAAPGESTASPDAEPGTELLVFLPVRDAYVDETQPDANRGADEQLRADGAPSVIAFIHFKQPSLDDIDERHVIERVVLEVYVNAAHPTGYRVSVVDEPASWSEASLTFANAPPIGAVVGSSGPVAAGAWVSVDLGVPVGDQDLESFALTTDSETALSLASREAGDLAPRLVYAVAAE
jgi:hypothetical protein